MKDVITIRHLANVSQADIDGFNDVLRDTLSDQGTTVSVTINAATPMELSGAAVRIAVLTNFHFTTPDGVYKFGEKSIGVEVYGDRLDHTLLLKVLVARNHQLEQGYRRALHDIYSLAADIKDGKFTPDGDALEYLTKTLEAAVEAIPNIG